MKVLFYFSFFFYSVGLLNSLCKYVEVIALIPKSIYEREDMNLLAKEIKVEVFDDARVSSPFWILNSILVAKSIRNHKPDLIHIQAHGGLWFSLIYLMIRNNIIVNTVHDVNDHYGHKRKYYKIMGFLSIFFTSHYLVHGDSLKTNLIRKFSISEHRITTTKVGSNIYVRNLLDKKIKQESDTVLFFGRLVRYKGLKYLLKAEPLVSKVIKNFKIIIVVHGPESLRNYYSLIKNRERYEIIERYVDEREMVELFLRSTLVVLPYVEASQSGIIPISFALERPVIASDVGAIAEVIENNFNGILVEPRNYKELADNIIRLLRDDDERLSLARNGLKTSQTQLSWEEISKVIHKKYIELLNNKS